MDIFFFIYYLFFGLPLGVVELPHVVDADEVQRMRFNLNSFIAPSYS